MAIADDCAARGHRVSAARAYLRAANYFAVAVNAIDGLDSTDQHLPTFRAHRVAWEGFVANTRWPVERIDIPYEGTSMPGWIFRPQASGAVRPTLVMNLGSDEAITGVWSEGAEGALERGYNVVVFEGPGQQSMLFERDIPFRPDWEKVLTPVVDFLLARDDVDADRLCLYGVSQAGYWVPRALAFEHRFAAAIADGGVVDVLQSWLQNSRTCSAKPTRVVRRRSSTRRWRSPCGCRGGRPHGRRWRSARGPTGSPGSFRTCSTSSRSTT